MKTLKYITIAIAISLLVFGLYILWDYYIILFWIVIIPLIIGALFIIFIALNLPKEYHYEDIESETWLKDIPVSDFKHPYEWVKPKIDIPNELNIDYDTRS